MSSARDRVVANIRRSLNRREPFPPSVTRGLTERLTRPSANLQPAMSGDPVDLFVRKLKGVNGRVTRVTSIDHVSPTVMSHLKEFDLPFELVIAPDPRLEEVPWSNRLAIERRAAHGDDRVSVTSAFAGVAETGSVVLLSGPESPTTLNFLPDDHIVVLREARVVPYIEDVWVRLREETKQLPRTVNFITGPSKTADVELKIQEGAHGPRRVHVILVAS